MAFINARFWTEQEYEDTRGVETRSQGNAAFEDILPRNREVRGTLTVTKSDLERMAEAMDAREPVRLFQPYFSRPFEFLVTGIHGAQVELRCGQPVKDG